MHVHTSSISLKLENVGSEPTVGQPVHRCTRRTFFNVTWPFLLLSFPLTLGFCPVGSGAGTFSYRKPCCEVIYTETHLRGRSPPHQYQYGRCARGRSDHEAISGRGLYAAWCVLRMRAWSMSCACNGSKMSQPPRATIHCPTGATPA